MMKVKVGYIDEAYPCIQRRILEKYPGKHIQSTVILDLILPEKPESFVTSHFPIPEDYERVEKVFLHLYFDNPFGKMFWGYRIYWGKIGEKWDKNKKQLPPGETQIEEHGVFLDVTEAFTEVDKDDHITSVFGRQSRNPDDTLDSIIRVLYLHIIYNVTEELENESYL